MRRIIVTMWVTLDNFVAGPQDEMDWLLLDEHLQRYEQELVEGADSLLLGRITHGDFAGYWPDAARNTDESDETRAYAQRLDAMEKIVVSGSGDTATWPNTRRIDRLDANAVSELKRGPGGDIVVYGSLGVVQALVDLDGVDEFHLLVHPVLLHRGKTLLGDGRPPTRLDLVSAEPFDSGVVLMKYGQRGRT